MTAQGGEGDVGGWEKLGQDGGAENAAVRLEATARAKLCWVLLCSPLQRE